MIPSLIEEVQTMANRMEMALSDMKDLKVLKEEIVDKKEELDSLKDKIKKLEKKKKQSTAEAKQEDMQINTTTGTSNLG